MIMSQGRISLRILALACTTLALLALGNLPTAAAVCGNQPFPYKQSKVEKVQESCADGTTNQQNCAKEGCYLYVKDSKPNANNPPFFVTGSSGDDHRLVVPVLPCRGVEDISSQSGCKGEDIWDAAWNEAQAKGSTEYGVAVNPTNKRGQHQLHIHVARVQRDLQAELKKISDQKIKTFTPIDCAGTTPGCPGGECGKAQAVKCTAKIGTSPSGPGIVAKWVDAKDIATAVKPFESAKGDTACTAILVSQPSGPGTGFVLVHANNRAAECMLYCTKTSGSPPATECQGHCQTDNLGC